MSGVCNQLGKRPNPDALRFDSGDDAVAFAKHCVEDSRRWYRANSLDVLKGYVNLDLALVLKVNAPFRTGVFDFVFLAVPNEGIEKLNAGTQELPAPVISIPALAPTTSIIRPCLLALHKSWRA